MMITQLSLRHWPGMRLTWTNGCVVLHAGDEPGAGAMAVAAAATSPSELCVVVGSHRVRMHPYMIEELADILAGQLPWGCTGLRLVAWDGACTDDDRPAPAYLLAARLGIAVIAPAGPLLGVPGGSLFAPRGNGPERPGGWWRFLPGTTPIRVGWRFPTPAWEADLNLFADLGNDLVIEQIPAGVWVHRQSATSVNDLVYSVPVDPAEPALVLSHPAEVPLRSDELAGALNALSPRAAHSVVFTPYGPQPLSDGRLGEVAAALVGEPVRSRTGLPLHTPSGNRAVVTVDENGVPRWRPFARELRHAAAGGAPDTVDWVNPAPGALAVPTGPATFDLGYRWVAEVIEAGLWLRPEHTLEAGDWVRSLPLDVDRCTIVVGVPDAPDPTPPGGLIAALLDQLPSDARARLQLAIPRNARQHVHQLVAELQAQVSGVGDLLLLDSIERRVSEDRRQQPAYEEQYEQQWEAPEARAATSTLYRSQPDEYDTPAERDLVEESDEPEDLAQSKEIKSHRTGAKRGRAQREEEATTASDTAELKRLLGFFDEIRRAKAWDEGDG